MARRKGSALLLTREIRPEHWDENEYVIIRALNGDDGEWIQDQLAEVVTDAQQGKQKQQSTMNMRLGKTQRLTLVRGIADWQLFDEAGNPVEWPKLAGRTEAENALVYRRRSKVISEHLAPEDRAYLGREIDALNEPMDAEEQESFFEKSSSGTPAKAKGSRSQS